jgi:hypothetical protein
MYTLTIEIMKDTIVIKSETENYNSRIELQLDIDYYRNNTNCTISINGNRVLVTIIQK